MSLFDRKITAGTADEGEVFFGIVKSGIKGDRIGVIDEGAIGEIVGCFTKYADGNIEKNAEIKVDINLPEEFDPKKVKLHFVAEGEKKGPRDLKGYSPNEVQVQAFYGDDPLDEALLPLQHPSTRPHPLRHLRYRLRRRLARHRP